ncbi:ComEC/Rec2 family competence protein [Flavobacterium sp. KACC 22761]|uniref:ComEC/Rec2 family competence protein n=1 Tax=Flavobacterium sp. KACC 22761 TaxID=3092665 RepID=UPI002A74E0D8|nr:ComEC/Rec2 family competence protein [Flavobacterium sp. KACC 22761]WPO80500.1 ComEC/Rec2 family competence protein [Flavobacterium sp. KACC 22761]
MKVLDFPLARITIWFILGIVFFYYITIPLFVSEIALGLGPSILIVFYFLSKRNRRFISFFGASTYFISFFIGGITLIAHTNSLQKSNYIHYQKAFETPSEITFILREKLKSNSYSDRFTALIQTIDGKTHSGKIIVNIAKDSLKSPFVIGNIIKTKTTLQKNNSTKNPNQFDYDKYLEDRQIYAQVYLNKAEIKINTNIKKDIWYYADYLHRRIIHNLEKAHFNPAEMNVALALILGQQQEISSDIIQDYQYSGATHILSVSGLHVGFIMLLINFILKPIPNTRKGSFIKLISVLTALSFFAIISGLSPPVLRSVIMFSFLAIGNHLRRAGNIYHTLLVSMLLILLFEPYFLFDVGFQLSYIALFFILWLQPLLKKLWNPKNKIALYIWNALTVSFAAQIGAFPLCLYYFHQFPGLFFVTNIAIIPVLAFVMIAGILVTTYAVFDSPPLFLAQILEKSIYLLNQIIHAVASIKSFVILDISFNFYFLLTFYLLIIAAIVWFKKPDYPKLVLFLISIILVQLSFIYTKRENETQKEMIIYNAKKQTLITVRSGKNIKLFTSNKSMLANPKNNILNSYLVGNFSKIKSASEIKNVLFYNDKKIFIIDSSGVYTNKTQPDILLLTQSSKINLDRVLEEIHPKTVIADASNSNSIQKIWKKTCAKKNIPFHATAEKGYYKLK